MKIEENNEYIITKVAGTKAIFTKRNKYNFSKFLEMNQETIDSFLNLEELFAKEEENINCLYVPNAEHTNLIVLLEECTYYKMVQYNKLVLKMPKPLCDGIVTTDKSKSLIVFPGDCIVVAGVHQTTGVRFIFHAGWRGVAGNIAKEMAKKLKELSVNLNDMEIIIFPSISKEVFQLDSENGKSFSNYPEYLKYNLESEKYNIDLVAILKSQLTDEGFCKNNILEMSYCTYSASNKNGYMFNSYRRDKSIQRNAAILLGEYI